MRGLYAVFLALLISGLAAAQSGVDKQIESKQQELNSAGVDTTVVYYRYLSGAAPGLAFPADSTCLVYEIKYLVWSRVDQTFVQRFDNCTQHQPMAVSSTFIKTIKSNYKKLVTEESATRIYLLGKRRKNQPNANK